MLVDLLSNVHPLPFDHSSPESEKHFIATGFATLMIDSVVAFQRATLFMCHFSIGHFTSLWNNVYVDALTNFNKFIYSLAFELNQLICLEN